MEELNPKKNKKSSDAPRTQDDIAELEEHLAKMGKL
jgi:hypothetical protein